MEPAESRTRTGLRDAGNVRATETDGSLTCGQRRENVPKSIRHHKCRHPGSGFFGERGQAVAAAVQGDASTCARIDATKPPTYSPLPGSCPVYNFQWTEAAVPERSGREMPTTGGQKETD